MRTYGDIVVMDDGDDIHDVIEASPEGARILLPTVVETDRTLRPKRGQHLQGQGSVATVLRCIGDGDFPAFSVDLDLLGLEP